MAVLSAIVLTRALMTVVSKGYGLGFEDGWSEQETPLNMNRMIFDHLNDRFPAPQGEVIGQPGGDGKNGFVNGAQGGQGELSPYSLPLKSGTYRD